MSKVEIKSFNKKIRIDRVLGNINGKHNSPTVVILGGIHGNEKAGIYALNRVLQKIEKENIKFEGKFYAISGNLNALQNNIRFEIEDLNRIWTDDHLAYINTPDNGFNADVNEQIALYEIIKDILSKEKGPFYFIDLHTTSSNTAPFITISDSLNNRKYTANFDVPIVLGIEEYLDGPLLTYINEYGHIALGFEGGQHDDYVSVINCEAFIWLALKASGCVKKDKITGYKNYKKVLSESGFNREFYEIDYRYLIKDHENFTMNKGFTNFDPIRKDELLAFSDTQEIRATMDGQIFMPLYQKQGDDGFFIITKISKIWLKLSILVRKLHLHHILRILPGIKIDRSHAYTLIVNPRTAKFLATEIFHLFGYRKQVVKDDKLHFIKRDRKVKEFR